jgi:RNA polymerase sigma factor (sigma-70 family)
MVELNGTYVPPAEQKPIWDAYIAATDPVEKRRHRDRLYKANLALVIHYVTKNHGKRGNLMDLIQEGNIGLLRAIEKFDPSRGHAFSTYAMWWLGAHVNTAAKRMNSPVHVPLNLLRAATIPVQVYIDTSPNKAGNAADGYHADRVSVEYSHPEDLYTTAEARSRAENIVEKLRDYLDERELYILEHYMLPDDEDADSLQLIAERYNCSREWVRQCALKVRTKLKQIAAGRRPSPSAKSRHSQPVEVKETTLDLARFGLQFFVQPPAPSAEVA